MRSCNAVSRILGIAASQFVPVFSEEPVVEEQELVSEMVQ
jgi:hypothetical protein